MAAARGTPVGEDDLSRQRRKREARLLAQPVTGFPDVTLGDLVSAVLAAREESGGALDEQRFLADRGHCWQTIETVLAYVEGHDGDRTRRSNTGVVP